MRICLHKLSTRLNQLIQQLADLTFSVPTSLSIFGIGILTYLPSTTLFSLALGTDSPYADERCVGNLGLLASPLFTDFIATHVSIRTSDISTKLLSSASTTYRTLPYHNKIIRSFGVLFSPVTSSAQDDSTSELLRFL